MYASSPVLAAVTTLHVCLLIARHQRSRPAGARAVVLLPHAAGVAGPWLWPQPFGLALGVALHAGWFALGERWMPPAGARARPAVQGPRLRRASIVRVLRARHRRLKRDLLHIGVHPAKAAAVVSLTFDAALALRRVALLARTKRLFDLWHLFHQPLVYFLFLIVLLHVVVVSYMGYSVLSGLVPH